MNSRKKGAVGELEFSKVLKSFGVEARRGQQFSGGGDSPDVVHNIPGIHFEVKRVERLDIPAWIEQAQNDAGPSLPVVASRRNRGKWIAMIDMDDFLRFLTRGGAL